MAAFFSVWGDDAAAKSGWCFETCLIVLFIRHGGTTTVGDTDREGDIGMWLQQLSPVEKKGVVMF